MSKKLICLVSVVLVLSLAGTNVVFGSMVVEVGIRGGNDSVEDQLERGMYTSSSDLEFPNDGGLQVIGLRFMNVEVPRGADILEAYIVFTVNDQSGSEAVNLIIDGELSPDAPAFTSSDYNVSERARTAAKALWQPEAWPTPNRKQQTSDISAVISEIVNQAGWAGGNAMAIIISDDPDNPSKGVRVATSGTGTATMLHIEFSSKRAIVPSPKDGVYIDDTWVSLIWRPGETAVSHDVYFGENFDDVDAGTTEAFQANQTLTEYTLGFPGFPYPDGLTPGATYYWRIDEVEADGTTKHKGFVWSFTVPPKTAYLPDPADGAEQVDPNVQLSWTEGFGSKFHYVYFGDNFDEVDNAAGGIPQGATTYTPGTLTLAKTFYWRIDEFDAIETHKGDVWSFTTEGGVGSPDPANGAVDVKQTPILTWTPGVYAASHQIYFGNDQAAVRNADTGSPEYKGAGDLGSQSYEPGKLEWYTTYYWRIDELNNANADSPWTGNVWSFTTANFLIVDDFESYNDLNPEDPGSNRIFNAWIDGYGIPTNGSLVGYENPPFAEQTIVHSGNQSMPLFYDNSVGYSEATLTLTYPRDWTEKGVNALTIWFRGNSDNAAETLYVALNGNAIVTNDNPDAAQVTAWTEWTIDLQAFADQGVNLANVNTIAIGLGNKNNPVAGGSGTMYIDDIRLYPPAL
ncbi:MAG TPA: hypothetical protein VMW72_09685 [Sedimentisphaerales bacterium]|nr:hypothetical protein [Sedimentisphaerales bacterium]